MVLAGVAASLLAASCGGSVAPPGATVPDSVLGAPPPSPYAVPRVITKAYVQRVLNAIEAVQAQATADIVAHRAYTPAAAALIHSVTTQYQYNFDHRAWQMLLSSGLPDIPAHPGAIVDTVQKVFPSTSTCIFASLNRNFSAVNAAPPAGQLDYVHLEVAATGAPNPTPWLVNRLGYNSQGLVPGDPCS